MTVIYYQARKNKYIVAPIILILIFLGSGSLLRFSIGPISTSIAEVVTIFSFIATMMHPKFHKDTLWKYYLIVLLASAYPLILGAVQYGVVRSLRSYQWIIFLAVVFPFITLKISKMSAVYMLNSIFLISIISVFVVVALYFLNMITYSEFEAVGTNLRTFSLYAFFYSIYRWLGNGSRQKFYNLYLIMSLIPLFFLFSLRWRAFYLGVFLGLLIMVLLYGMYQKNSRNIRKALVVTFVSLLVAFVWLYAVFFPSSLFALRLSSLFGSDLAFDITASYRLNMWTTVWEIFRDNPLFGIGFGRYLDFNPEYFGVMEISALYSPQMMHNSFLEILYSGGVILAVTVILFYFELTRTFLSAFKRTNNSLYLSSLGFITSYLIISFFSGVFSSIILTIPYWVIVGIMYRMAKSDCRTVCH